VIAARLYNPKAAEDAFYRAFERTDIEAMMAVWDDSPDTLCIHPGGAVLHGPQDIRASWVEIFQSAARVQFAVQEQLKLADDHLAVFVVHELLHIDGRPPAGPIIATNAYRLTDNGWRMVLHHAVPAPRATTKSKHPPSLH